MAPIRFLLLAATGVALSLTCPAQSPGPIGGATQGAGQLGGAARRISRPYTTATGVWTLANSPYVLRDDVYVVNLTIEAGVEVVAEPGVEIVVVGKLIAQGSPGATIHFHNASAQGKWDGLRFDRATGDSLLEYCRIDGSRSSGIQILNSTVTLRDCEVYDNETGSSGGGISASIADGDLVLENCLVLANSARDSGGGIDARLPNGELVLDGCAILDNSVNAVGDGDWTQGGGVRCWDSGALYVTGSTIRGNSVVAHDGYLAVAQGGGLWVGNTPLVLDLSTVEDNVIDSWCDGGYCDASAWGGGLYLEDSTASLTLSVVRENSIHARVIPYSGFNKESCSASGAGVYLRSNARIFEATNCLIAGNEVKSTCKWNGSYGAGLNFQGNGLGSDLHLTNCVISRNLAIDGGWYAGGGGPVRPGVVIGYDSFSPYQGGDGLIQNTIATENRACNLDWYDPGQVCAAFVPPALYHATSVVTRVDYSIFENSVLTGIGNIGLEPEFVGLGTTIADFTLAPTSAAIDAGNPAPVFEDVAFPPSQGSARNDMGILGGPLAGGWSQLPSPP